MRCKFDCKSSDGTGRTVSSCTVRACVTSRARARMYVKASANRRQSPQCSAAHVISNKIIHTQQYLFTQNNRAWSVARSYTQNPQNVLRFSAMFFYWLSRESHLMYTLNYTITVKKHACASIPKICIADCSNAGCAASQAHARASIPIICIADYSNAG